MERKKYYGIMFCVVSFSKFVMPAQAGRRSPAVQTSDRIFSESDRKRLYELEKKFNNLNDQFCAYCLKQQETQTNNFRQFQTQARATVNQQKAISLLQKASLAHEKSIQAIQRDIEELQQCLLQLDQEQQLTDESVVALRNMVHLLIAQTVDDMCSHEDALHQQRSRRSVVPRLTQGGERSSLRRSRAMYQLHEQNGGWFVPNLECD